LKAEVLASSEAGAPRQNAEPPDAGTGSGDGARACSGLHWRISAPWGCRRLRQCEAGEGGTCQVVRACNPGALRACKTPQQLFQQEKRSKRAEVLVDSSPIAII